MGEDAIKLPLLGWELPRPAKWDLVAVLVLVGSVLLAGLNLRTALGQPAGDSITGTMTAGMVVAQLVLTSLALLVLGKTAKEGTLWGNLASVAALLAGVSGVLLATALWAIA
ncbi:MAG: hypothetical protein ACE5GX_17280 [Thermoanaerobaculia bacterium]